MNKRIFVVSVLVLLLDQLSKIIVSSFIALNEEIVILQNFFKITYLNNYGAAFSIMNFKVEFLSFISIIILVIIYRFIYSFKNNLRNNVAFGFIIGGLVGNLIDRVFLGFVRDFLAFKIFGFNFPVFNLADSFIVIGVILLVFAIIKGEDKINEN